jgi:hypothetical protein
VDEIQQTSRLPRPGRPVAPDGALVPAQSFASDGAGVVEEKGLPPLRIFINYRQEDTQGTAWALCFKLEEHFGAGNVFFDNGTLRPGDEWLEEIVRQLSSADVFLALIGAQWKRMLVARMKPRVVDHVAKEIELAFQVGRAMTVIPVVIDIAEIPQVNDLLPCLRPLPACHVERLRHTHLRSDIDHLIGRLEEIRRGKPATGPEAELGLAPAAQLASM